MNRFALTLLLVSVYVFTDAAALTSNFYPKTLDCPPGPSIVLADTIPPTISCPPNFTVAIESANCDTVLFYNVTADDNEPGVIVAKVSGIASGQPFPVGTTTNVFLAVDAAGNTASCSFSVKVNPPASGSFSCRDLVLFQLDIECKGQMIADDLLLPPFGCTGSYLIELDRTAPFGNGPWSPAEFGPLDFGKTFQARATHIISGNKCWGNVKLVDSLPPVLICKDIEISCAVPASHLEPAFLNKNLHILDGVPFFNEACYGLDPTLTFSDLSVNLPCDTPGNVTGYIKRTWLGADESGNSTSCVQTINRVRNIDTVVYPADITVSCADPNISLEHAGGPKVPAGDTLYSLLTAPFCEIDAFYDDSIEMLCGGSRRIHRLWTITDACRPSGPGNPVTGVQLIDVLDMDAPVFQCPSDTVLTVMTDSCTTNLNLLDLIVHDNCSTVEQVVAFWTVGSLTHSLIGSLGDFPGNDPASSDTLAVLGEAPDFPVGQTAVLYIATDVCGNTASCEIAVQLWDSMPPVAVCDSFLTVVLNGQGQAILPANVPAMDTSDACGPLFFKIKRTGNNLCFPDSSFFDDQLVFCCAETYDTLQLTIRVYDVLTPPGPVSNSFGAGQYTDCTVSVLVQDTLAPVCVAPLDVTVDCDDFSPDLTTYGSPTFSCRTDSIAEVHDFSQLDTNCMQGTISRVFTVFDTAGSQSGQCTQRIVVDYHQDYYVRFPDDLIVTVCDTTGQYNAPQLFGTLCENMSVSFTDEIFTVVPDACYKIERIWKVLNTCTYDSAKALITIPNPQPMATINHPSNLPGPTVSAPGTAPPWAPSFIKINPADPMATDFSKYWAADANGYQYKQIIKVIDSNPPEFSCPSGAQVLSDNTPNDALLWNESYWFSTVTGSHDLCEAPANLCLTASDLCSGADISINYLLFLDLDNNGTQETVVSSYNLPSFNNVQFGNASNSNYTGGQSRAFDKRSVLPNQKYGFALQTTTSGRNKTACVRWNTQQMPLNYSVPQLPHGTHKIRWIVEDQCGNDTSCQYEFTITDGTGDCGAPDITVSGNIVTEQGAGVDAVNIRIDVNPSMNTPYTLTTTTDQQGAYSFQVGSTDSYTVIPRRNDDHLNGVSTLDLVLINKHVLGLEPLSTPFKIIAADANGSRSVSTFDIIELRKLILGIYTELPNSPSWRFVDAAFNFPNPGNPFQTILPETQNGISPLPPGPVHDFIAAKVGDVNGNALANANEPANDDRSAAILFFDLPDLAFAAGEVFTLPMQAAMPVEGFQFSLDFTGLELLELQTGPDMEQDNFAVFPKEKLLTASWSKGGQVSFALKFRALEKGRLSDLLQCSNRITRAEAYQTTAKGAVEILPLALRFNGKKVQSGGFELFQNQPNPFAGSTSIGFYLPEAETATFRLLDGLGREWYNHTEFYSSGLHTIVLEKQFAGATAGIWYYVLETDHGHAVRKMVLLR